MKDDRVLSVTYNTRDEFVIEWEKNISKGGIFLPAATSSAAPPGIRQSVSIVIEVRDSGARFELAGEAVHITPHGVGVHLQPLSPEAEAGIRQLLSAATAPKQEETDSSKKTDESLYQNIQGMSRIEKLAAARKGGLDTRTMLLRDHDPAVVMNVILNPRLTVAEVIQLTAMTSLTLDMIKMIVSRADWLAVENVCLNLVLNPKTPLPTALSLLSRLSEKNVRMLARRPIKQAIKSAAIKIVLKN